MSSGSRRFKDDAYGHLARIGKAASSPKRLELLDLLGQGPRTVEQLAELAGLSVANASQHLKVLRAARLVDAEKKGLYVEHRLAAEEVGDFLVTLRRLAQARLAEIDRISHDYLEQRGSLEPVAGEDLLVRVRRGEVTVLDVRPAEEHRAGHIPGALSVPLTELKARLGELPRNRAVVAYCRGPYCVMSADAVALLQKAGFRAHRLEAGVLDWRARGWRLSVEGSAKPRRATPGGPVARATPARATRRA